MSCVHENWPSVKYGGLTRPQKNALLLLEYHHPYQVGNRTWNSLIKRGLVTAERKLTEAGTEYAKVLR